MLTRLKFRFGSSAGAGPLELNLSPITIFVGPNNSGKSLVLREIEQYCRQGRHQVKHIVDELIAKPITPDAALKELKAFEMKPVPGQVVPPDHLLLGRADPHQEIEQRSVSLPHFRANIGGAKDYLFQHYLTFFTLRLDGRTRFSLTDQRPAGDLQQPPKNVLMALFKDDVARKRIREVIADAFGSHFVIDPTAMTVFRIKMSDRPPADDAEEQSLDARARDFHAAAHDVAIFSDGVKAFTGVIAAVMSADYKIILLDEPEAFLHPPLSKKLGYRLASLAKERSSNLFVATHSSDFLMGCVQSGAPINIVRLTYRDRVATARLLPPATLLSLMRHPLLRSTNVLSSLFFEAVAVTESDTDRAFYAEINERLLTNRIPPQEAREQPLLGLSAANAQQGAENCLFINAQNKQTIWTILDPLRRIGIPAAAIVDIDVIKDGGQEWMKLLRGAFIPDTLHQSLQTLRATIRAEFEKTGKDMKRDGGISLLDKDGQAAFQSLIDQLAEYGVFVVPGGEIESWLKHLGATGHGPQWLLKMFETMGADPAAAEFVKPTNGDVWEFVERVARWVREPRRKGIPE